MAEYMRHTGADDYAASHQHPANRALHGVGIPVIACCAVAALLGPRVVGASRRAAVAGMVAGSALLFLGHAIEGNRPVIFSRTGAAVDALRWWGSAVLATCRRAFDR